MSPNFETTVLRRRQRYSTGLHLQWKNWLWSGPDRLTSVPSAPSARLQFRACGSANARFWALDREVNGGYPQPPVYRAPATTTHRHRNRLSSRPAQLPAPDSSSPDELRREWRRLYRSEPPKISRDLLIRGIGYRLQEIQHGGLGKTTLRKLKTLAKMFRATGRVAPDLGLSLKPGARLVREWHGRTHTVTVTEDGFDYAGMSYPSLTKVAKKITGARWSGPRFFGLVRVGSPRPSNRGDLG